MSRKHNAFDDSAKDNNRTYIRYVDRLTELSVSMFDWKNLPETVDPRFLELTLMINLKVIPLMRV